MRLKSETSYQFVYHYVLMAINITSRCQYHPLALGLLIGFIGWFPLQLGAVIWGGLAQLTYLVLFSWICHLATVFLLSVYWLSAICMLLPPHDSQNFWRCFMPSNDTQQHTSFVFLLFYAFLTPFMIGLALFENNFLSGYVIFQMLLDCLYLVGYIVAIIVAQRSDRLTLLQCCWPKLPGTDLTTRDDNDLVCPICLEDYRPHEKVLRSACGHTAHRQCLLKTVKATEKMECPYCRQHLENAVLLSKT